MNKNEEHQSKGIDWQFFTIRAVVVAVLAGLAWFVSGLL